MRCCAVGLAAALLIVTSIGAGGLNAADDDRAGGGRSPAASAQTELRPFPSPAGPRVYVPVKPADPAQADKQFAIGQESAFGLQSEELIRSGHHQYQHNATAGKSETSRAIPAPPPRSPSALPAPR